MTGTFLWFPKADYYGRVARLQAELAAEGLDGVIAIQPESVLWLTGFRDSALCAALVARDGQPVIFCREGASGTTCAFEGQSNWTEAPMATLAEAARHFFGDDARVAIETEAWALTASRWIELSQGISLEDAGTLVARLRLIKSPPEIEYLRRATRAAEAGIKAGARMAKAGVSEREVMATVSAAIILAGGYLAGHPSPTGDRRLAAGEMFRVEAIAAVRHYQARVVRTLKLGPPSVTELEMAKELAELADRSLERVAPGAAAEEADRVYRAGLLQHGVPAQRLPPYSFTSTGMTVPPGSPEPLQVAPGCGWAFEAGQVLVTEIAARGIVFADTVLVTPTGAERLTQMPLELVVV